jgi:hypothetical protein
MIKGNIFLKSIHTVSFKAILLLLLSFGWTCSVVKADCSYGDTSYIDRSELKQADNKLYICVSGKWIGEKSISPLIDVENASLWTDCCGWTDITFYAKEVCDARRECSIPAAAGQAEKDQDPRRWRRLLVAYHCEIASKEIPTSHYAKQAEESAPLKISCKLF